MKGFLASHTKGRLVLALFSRDGRLTKEARQMLVELVVQQMMQDNDE